MIPLIPVLLAVAAAVPGSEAPNSVHEWGVVVFNQTGALFCDSPWQYSVNYPGTPSVETYAPVVWFYGEPFTGTFSVSVDEGQIVGFAFPTPDRMETSRAEWKISGFESTGEEDTSCYRSIYYNGPFEWAAAFWRSVPSLQLSLETSGMFENFLYYDCTVAPEFTKHFFTWDSLGNPVFESYPLEDALYFSGNDIPDPVIWRNGAFIPLNAESRPYMARSIFSEWADSKLNNAEISALWETWQPVFTEEGSNWLVFPIPEEFYDEISTIALSTVTGSEVDYHRFYLGAVRANLW
jgi:hypothetical protein